MDFNEENEFNFELDVRIRYRVCYTNVDNNKTYTRSFNSLESAKFIYDLILNKNTHNKYKNIRLYEVYEHRRNINEIE